VRTIFFTQASEKCIVKYIISLIAKFSMYILGTVCMSLLNMIMIRRITLPVVANIKGNAYTGTWYCAKR